MAYFSIILELSIISVISSQTIDTTNIRVFPAVNQTFAGVFQVSYLNNLNQPYYAFNASGARSLCSSLGVSIASKAQVQEALNRGLETCRYGWVDEHFAVIPRINALSNCGQNQTGLVTWRARVTQVFDVFCFSESDAVKQLKNTATDPSSTKYVGKTLSPSSTTHLSHTTSSTPSSSLYSSPSSAPQTIDREAESARFVGTARNSAGAKAVLVSSTCALLLTVIFIITYLKLQKSCSQSSDMKQEYIETEEWMCVKNVKETKKAQEDERIEIDDSAS